MFCEENAVMKKGSRHETAAGTFCVIGNCKFLLHKNNPLMLRIRTKRKQLQLSAGKWSQFQTDKIAFVVVTYRTFFRYGGAVDDVTAV